jgi:tetratricopeptide (TPR) repeat protein
MIEAQRHFRNAIAADPGFALAYVGLADTLLMNQPNADEAWVVLSRALELDPNLAEAHASLGFHEMFYGWKWDDAEVSFKRSLELNPNYATAHHWYATLLAIKGETEAAKAEMRKALEINPISHNFLADLGQIYYFSGEYEEAERYCREALAIYPNFTFAHEYLHYIYLKTGRYEESVKEMAEADAINTGFAHDPSKTADPLPKSAAVLHESGIQGYYEYRCPGISTTPSAFYLYAIKHALAGENQQALDYLERSVNARMFLSAFTKANPIFDGLRLEPRYQDLLRKMGLA